MRASVIRALESRTRITGARIPAPGETAGPAQAVQESNQTKELSTLRPSDLASADQIEDKCHLGFSLRLFLRPEKL